MQPLQFPQNVQNQAVAQQATDYRPGQIMYGKITKIYPNQTAEVQIGNHKVVANLDAPLQAGEKYWLQVQPGEGKLHLKVLNQGLPIEGSRLKDVATQLLKHLSLPHTKESVELAQFLLKNQMPVSKEVFQKAMEWLKTTSNMQQGLSVLKTMHIQNLPQMKDVFQALLSLEKGLPLHTMLGKLSNAFNQSVSSSDTIAQAKAIVGQMLTSKQEQFITQGLNKITSQWLNVGLPESDQKTAFNILKAAGFIGKNQTEADMLGKIIQSSQGQLNSIPNDARAQLLKNVTGILPQVNLAVLAENETGMDNILKALQPNLNGDKTVSAPAKSVIENADMKAGNTNQPHMLQGKTSEAETIMKAVQLLLNGEKTIPVAGMKSASENETLKANNQSINTGVQTSSLQGNQMLATKHVISSFLTNPADDSSAAVKKPLNQAASLLAGAITKEQFTQAMEKLDRLFTSLQAQEGRPEMLRQAETQLLKNISEQDFKPYDFTKGATVASFLKEISTVLGLNFENVLSKLAKGTVASLDELQSLKPTLMKLLNENPPMVLRDAAEQVLHRITAQQILSQEAGPIQNIAMQIPLVLAGHKTDLTLQWNGRRKSDGSIDPGYCRILFYLELEHIKETVIDMQVQNRIINISITNNQAEMLQSAAKPFLEVLKHNLQELEYKLSDITFENPTELNVNQPLPSGINPMISKQSAYNGVDIRI